MISPGVHKEPLTAELFHCRSRSFPLPEKKPTQNDLNITLNFGILMRLARYHYTQTRIPLFWPLVPKKTVLRLKPFPRLMKINIPLLIPLTCGCLRIQITLSRRQGRDFNPFPLPLLQNCSPTAVYLSSPSLSSFFFICCNARERTLLHTSRAAGEPTC